MSFQEEDDFFGASNEREAQRVIAERDLHRMEQEFMTMGFRQGALEEIENKEKAALNKGLYDGMELTRLEGYINGKAEFVKSLLMKLSKKLDQSIVNDVNDKLKEILSQKNANELGENSIKCAFNAILEDIAKQLQ